MGLSCIERAALDEALCIMIDLGRRSQWIVRPFSHANNVRLFIAANSDTFGVACGSLESSSYLKKLPDLLENLHLLLSIAPASQSWHLMTFMPWESFGARDDERRVKSDEPRRVPRPLHLCAHAILASHRHAKTWRNA